MAEILNYIGELNVQKPLRFHARSEATALEERPIEELEAIYLTRSIELLRHPELHALVDNGNVTLGMIKPSANEGKNLPENDDEAAEEVLNQIDGVFFSIPIKMTPDEAEEFYKDTIAGLRSSGREDIVNLIVNFTSSGPLTVFLKSDSENAVANWRKQMGPTLMEEFSKPENSDTLRGRYAQVTENNIVHGSDSIESAHREINLLADMLQNRLRLTSL